MNLYADIRTFERLGLHDQHLDTPDLVEVLIDIEAASRQVDVVRGTPGSGHFYAETATEIFDGHGGGELMIPDLLSATAVKLDEDGDRTFELTLAAATDYRLLRRHHERQYTALPKTCLRLDSVNGQRSTFLCREALVEIAGVWGYTNTDERLVATGTLADATTTTLTLSADGDGLSSGQTLKIETEDVFVRSGAGKVWVVQRGVNSTAAAAHATKALDRYVYPPEVARATAMLTWRRWKRRESGYANVVVNAGMGTLSQFRKQDPDVVDLLAPYVRGDYTV